MTTRMHASVVVPAFNGIAELPECLDALRAQEAPFEYEVIVIDSGSTDGTVEMLEKRAATGELRLHQIPNEEFGHGRTRNLGAKIARGEFVCFLTQDATPAHPGWLVEMLRPFDVFGPRMACVFGKQVPRPDCVPTVKRDVLNHFAGFGPDYCISVQTAGSPLLADESYTGPVGFFSDVNSAVRRSILLDEIPYEDVDYAEDQVFGRAVIAAGYLKAYAPLGSVYHSHSYPPMTYLRRMYDEFAGLAQATGSPAPISRREFWLGWIRPTIGDLRFVRSDPSYTRRQKLRFMMQAPVYNVFRRLAIRIAANPNPSPRQRRLLSLEHRKRSATN